MKPFVLRDLTYAEIFNASRWYEIPVGKIKNIGRAICDIPIVANQLEEKELREKYEMYKEIARSVSRDHAEIRHNQAGLLYIINHSKKSFTGIEASRNTLRTKIGTNGKEQIFPNEILLLGNGYRLKLEQLDLIAIQKREDKIRMEDTANADLTDIISSSVTSLHLQ